MVKSCQYLLKIHDKRITCRFFFAEGQLGHFQHVPDLGGYQYLACVFECQQVLGDKTCNCTRVESALFDPEVGEACNEFDSLFCSYARQQAKGT